MVFEYNLPRDIFRMLEYQYTKSGDFTRLQVRTPLLKAAQQKGNAFLADTRPPDIISMHSECMPTWTCSNHFRASPMVPSGHGVALLCNPTLLAYWVARCKSSGGGTPWPQAASTRSWPWARFLAGSCVPSEDEVCCWVLELCLHVASPEAPSVQTQWYHINQDSELDNSL